MPLPRIGLPPPVILPCPCAWQKFDSAGGACLCSPGQFHGDLKPGAESGPLVEQIEKGFFGQKFVKTLLCIRVQQSP